MTIDANVYWFPEEIFRDDALLTRFLNDTPQGTHVYVKDANGRRQIVVERPEGCPGVDYVQGDYELDALLSALRNAGIDRAVLKVPCCHEWLSLPMCRLFNNGMADYAKRSGGMLVPLAVVPPYGDADSLAELQRCYHELGMRGVQLCAHYGDRYLDDPVFEPFFVVLNKLGLTAYVHHTPVPVEYGCLTDYNNLRRSYGRCCDQSIAVMRELFSGMFERYPRVRVVHSMLGGGFFAYQSLLTPHRPAVADAAHRFTDTSDALYKALSDNIFFEMSHAQPWGRDALECAVKVLGADHIVYGSSYPVRAEWMTEGAAFIRSLDISNADKALILAGNAQRLYAIDEQP